MKNKFILMFSGAYCYTLIMLFILNISNPPWFFMWLIFMHIGIVMLILTKRKFKDTKLRIKQNYKIAYISYLLFVPVLIYKGIAAILAVTENQAIIHTYIYFLIAICLITGIFNIFYFLKNNIQNN